MDYKKLIEDLHDTAKTQIGMWHEQNEKIIEKAATAITDLLTITALRPVSREQMEKVWRGEWNQDEHGRVVCSRCGSIAAIGTENALHNAKKYDRFCFYCGAAMTDGAVEIRLKELEAMEAAEKGEDMYGPFDSVADLMEALNA